MSIKARLYQAQGPHCVYGIGDKSASYKRYEKPFVRIICKDFWIKKALLSGGNDRPGSFNLFANKPSKIHSLVQHVNLYQSWSAAKDSIEPKSESALILVRRGESMWNAKNIFTGCVDVPLTKKGVHEAIEAGKRISNIPIDVIYTSALVRSQMTAMLAMTQHRCRKVPIVMQTVSAPILWSQVFSEHSNKESIPVVEAWQLNERMYGELQGLNKQETAERLGKEQVHKWRRSYDARPPNGESLEMCLGRAVTYFKEHIEPLLLMGKHVMISAHANSLRSIIMHLEKLTSEEVISLELSNGVPMLYIYSEGRFIRRGSPVGSTAASVYAYSESLALYKQKLDGMLL